MQKLPRLWLARAFVSPDAKKFHHVPMQMMFFFCLLFSDDCCRCNFKSRRIERKFFEEVKKVNQTSFHASVDVFGRLQRLKLAALRVQWKKKFEYAIDTHRMVGMKMSALIRLRVYFKRWTFFLLHFSMNELTPKIRYVSVNDIWDDSVRK